MSSIGKPYIEVAFTAISGNQFDLFFYLVSIAGSSDFKFKIERAQALNLSLIP